ncbi:MAG: protein-L-isoaspartate O-methyltransferase, partial [Rhizobiales bacterium TMED162]
MPYLTAQPVFPIRSYCQKTRRVLYRGKLIAITGNIMAAIQMNEDATAENRFNMVECQLKPGGIRDYRVTRQMSSVPREAFITGTSRDLAYADLQLQCSAADTERTMLTPTALALLIELADIQQDDVVLDIAGGTGYSAAVLAGLASTVIALEDDEAFNEKAGNIWQDLGVDNAVAVCGPLTQGQAKQGPFDVIFINGCLATKPEALLGQLAENGRLVCVQKVDGTQKAHIYRLIGDRLSAHIAFDN